MQIQTIANARYSQFGRNAVTLEAQGSDPLSLDTIRTACPAVFAEDKHFSRSEKYTFISTLQLLHGLAAQGFYPHSIIHAGSKDDGRRGFVKHFIRLRRQETLGRGGVHFEVCVLGSHDGSTSEQIFGGFLRAICKNGCIWFDQGAKKIIIPHKGDVLGQVVEGAFSVIGQAEIAYDSIDNLRRIELSRDEQLAFAAAASVARFDADSPVTPAALLVPRRDGDRANDLWTTFNRVQENVIRGGIGFVGEQRLPDGRTRTIHRHTAPIRSVDGDVRLNRALWTLADELAKIKSAA